MGVPVYEDKNYLNAISETFQAGLSWITILKEKTFKLAFDDFDYKSRSL
jgi:3-methyladenine DNA glycosylase Tag